MLQPMITCLGFNPSCGGCCFVSVQLHYRNCLVDGVSILLVVDVAL